MPPYGHQSKIQATVDRVKQIESRGASFSSARMTRSEGRNRSCPHTLPEVKARAGLGLHTETQLIQPMPFSGL